MNKKYLDKKYLIGAAGVVVAIALVVAVTTLTGKPKTDADDIGVPGVNNTVAEAPAQKVEPAVITPSVLTKPGIYAIALKPYQTAALATRYDFIKAALTPEPAPDQAEGDAPFTFDPQLPSSIKLAELSLPAKNLTLVAVYADDSSWCTRGFCLFNLYVKRPGGYMPYVGLNAAANSYLMVDEKSISLLVCSNAKGYRQWRLEDGALERPIPPDSPGHFVPLGIVKNDALAPCP